MPRKFLPQLNRENVIVIYKILHDILFIALVFFLLSMIAEGLLPTIVTSHVGFTTIIIFIFINLIAIYLLGNYLNISIKSVKATKKNSLLTAVHSYSSCC